MTLRELHVQNLAVMRDALLEPGAGFTVLTGETGAGKSVCVAALRLVLGGRTEPEAFRASAESARVRAVFDDLPGELRQRLDELGIPADELLTLTRELPRSGRTVCRVNGVLVSQAVLRELGEQLADVTAQGASHRVLQGPCQRRLLDQFGGVELESALGAAAAAFGRWRAATSALAEARAAAGRSAETVVAAADVVDVLQPLGLVAGEADLLAVECSRLRNASQIRAALESVATAASGEGGAADLLAASAPALEAGVRADPTLTDQLGALIDVVERARELGLDARRAAASVVVDDARLATVEERLDLLARVTRRFGSIDAALEELARAQETLAGATGAGRLDAFESAAAAAAAALGDAAATLSRRRAGAARRLERAVTAELQRLELPRARFRVVIGRRPAADGIDLGDGIPVRCHTNGVDDVEFRLATHPDMVPVPLGDGPSGGELSRLALALSAVVTGADPVALILDEVDTGIGGETAARVGDVLAAIGSRRQVIAVTHRAEIAARASRHLVVRRQAGAATEAVASAVDADERVDELARLLSGRLTAAARQRAKELLAEGASASGSGGCRPAASTM